MIDYREMTIALNWLKTKLVNGENGILFDSPETENFDVIQDFIESSDRHRQTPVIYYQAFPEESAVQFLDTLREELTSKLGNSALSSPQSLAEITKAAGLKMILIDDCHLHPIDTLNNLLDFFSRCNIAVILVGYVEKMAIAQILNHPGVSQWDKLITSTTTETFPKLNQTRY